MPDKGPSPYPMMPNIELTVSGIKKLLDNLKPQKASGPDSISPMVLKELSNEIAPILEIIFRFSLRTGEVPDDWKEANVAPIYKKGDKHKASNYRPVSLTCIASKIMEHIIVSNVMKHLETQNILSPLQHGFRRNHSCESQLLSLFQDLASSPIQVDMLIIDFSKAFDKVLHKRLNYKLNWYGIRGDPLGWITEFLSSRTQRVVLDGASSDSAPVISGVPQGTVLGPILFLIYINDLPDGVLNSTVRLFADDCIIYRPIRNKKGTELLQADLNSVGSWERTWLMEFNADKLFTIRAGRANKLIQKIYTLHNQPLHITNSAKYLGLTITSDLKWNTHINNITKKSNSILGLLRRNLRISSQSLKTQAYQSLIRPHLEYASTVWSPHTTENRHKLDRVQRRAARYACNRWHNTSSVSEMVRQLGWESLTARRLHMMYRVARTPVGDAWQRWLTISTRQTRGFHPWRYIPLSPSNDQYKYSFLPSTIPIWNSLPIAVVSSPNLDSFRLKLSNM